jgi:hypothetical protein
MMAAWEAATPGRIDQVARALGRVEPSQLADLALFDFIGLATGDPTAALDTVEAVDVSHAATRSRSV